MIQPHSTAGCFDHVGFPLLSVCYDVSCNDFVMRYSEYILPIVAIRQPSCRQTGEALGPNYANRRPGQQCCLISTHEDTHQGLQMNSKADSKMTSTLLAGREQMTIFRTRMLPQQAKAAQLCTDNFGLHQSAATITVHLLCHHPLLSLTPEGCHDYIRNLSPSTPPKKVFK